MTWQVRHGVGYAGKHRTHHEALLAAIRHLRTWYAPGFYVIWPGEWIDTRIGREWPLQILTNGEEMAAELSIVEMRR